MARRVVAVLVLCATRVDGGRGGRGRIVQPSTTFVYDHVYGEELDAASRAQLKVIRRCRCACLPCSPPRTRL